MNSQLLKLRNASTACSYRYLHVATPSVVTTSLNLSNAIKNVPEISYAHSDTYSSTKFEVVGSPPSLLRVSLSPSTALYTKRGSLVATFGDVGDSSNDDSLSSTLSGARYQRVVSTKPLSLLIRSFGPSMAVVDMDGSVDWLVNNDSLNSYAGSTLSSSSKGWRQSLLSGRGSLAIGGKGQIYQVTLSQGESLVVDKSTLVAYSKADNSKKPQLFIQPTANHNTVVDDVSREAARNHGRLMGLLRGAWSYLTFAYAKLKTYLAPSYLQMYGPTTLLIESSVHVKSGDFLAAPLNKLRLESILNDEVKTILGRRSFDLRAETTQGFGGSPNPRDHLKVVTVTNGKVSFESTDNFDEFTKR